MEPVTSLADFFRKAENDDYYKQALVRSYDNFFYDRPHTYEQSKEEIERWVQEFVGESHSFESCKVMVEWLNLFIVDANYKWNPH